MNRFMSLQKKTSNGLCVSYHIDPPNGTEQPKPPSPGPEERVRRSLFNPRRPVPHMNDIVSIGSGNADDDNSNKDGDIDSHPTVAHATKHVHHHHRSHMTNTQEILSTVEL